MNAVAVAWVLVSVLNGKEIRSEPMGSEACLLTMLQAPPQGIPPYCSNTITNEVMKRPPPCKQVRPNWCKAD